jgi:hypothetical protein
VVFVDFFFFLKPLFLGPTKVRGHGN